jgi:hypothetical protein
MTDTPVDRPLTLAEAAAMFGLTKAILLGQADRGRLRIFKLGRSLRTLLGDVEEMIRLCREEGARRGSTSIPSAALGESETERARSAQDALKRTVEELKRNSLNTSATSTSQRRHPVR